MNLKRYTAPWVFSQKKLKEKFSVLTCADYITAKLLDQAGIEVILVGDSLGTTLLGYESTVFVTMRDMLHHVKAVVRAKPRSLVVADLPFGSYHQSIEQAVRNAVRLVREGGADAVKLEGGKSHANRIAAIVDAGIPVMAHLGLLPQSVLKEGGYRGKGRTPAQVRSLKQDLKAVEKAGAFACVLEYVKADVAIQLTRSTSLPTIGIGSGKGCDAQVLVTSDLLGLHARMMPRAVRQYANLGEEMVDAFKRYKADVWSGNFPGPKESF